MVGWKAQGLSEEGQSYSAKIKGPVVDNLPVLKEQSEIWIFMSKLLI